MNLFEDTNPRDLKELLAQIHQRDAALPDFQRDFVWDPSATRELVVSIAQNFPAGSLLRIRNTKQLFACRTFEGAPHLNGHAPTYLVLDGQQRLTSLYQAFYGTGDHRYFINIRQLLDTTEVDECITYLKATNVRAKALSKIQVQAQELIMPLSVLRNGAAGFTQWTQDVIQQRVSANLVDQTEAFGALSKLGAALRWIQAIDDYRFPVVTLSDSTSADSVCTIFETLNRTGVKLGAFELLTARFWPRGINLRELWDGARTKYPLIEDFDVDPYYVLQSIALVAKRTPSCKRGDVLELEAQQIKDWWEPVIDGLARSLSMLRDHCGVIIPKWMPVAPTLVPLAAVQAQLGQQTGPTAGATVQRLRQWYWCAVFNQVYDQAPNSQAVRDYHGLREWLNGGEAPDVVRDFRFDIATLDVTTPAQRTLYKALVTLMLCQKPLDFHTLAPITGDLMQDRRIDDHHVFPDSWLKKNGVSDTTRRNCILNRTLIDRDTNKRISDHAPSDYLAEIEAQLGTAGLSSLLGSHLLPTGQASPLHTDSFDDFVTWRRAALFEALTAATGLAK